MRFWALLCLIAFLIAATGSKNASIAQPSANMSTAPVYTDDGKLVFPANYREWIYLTTGLDMDYSPTVNFADHDMFDNVFVNPDAYKAFQDTGTWPDKTIFVLEGRMAASKGSINKSGHYQTTDIMTRSVHIKDSSRFAATGGWAFFGVGDGGSGQHIELRRLNVEQVPPRSRAQDTGWQQLAQPGHIHLHRGHGRLRRPIAPELVDQPSP